MLPQRVSPRRTQKADAKSRWTRHYESDGAVQEYASLSELRSAEAAILDRMVGAGLAGQSMLDVGVGAGRTTLHFGPHAREYVGADISYNMIAACCSRFRGAEWEHATFEVCDVRDMRTFEDDRFDFVLFSYNGLDTLGGEADRLRALHEIHRVCSPGGAFCLSSHNLASLREYFSLQAHLSRARRLAVPAPLAYAMGTAWWAALRIMNPSFARLDRMDSAVIVESRHPALARFFYIRPHEQVRQLSAVGFRDTIVFSLTGEEVPSPSQGDLRDNSLYYLCWK